jgi:hypothetical protein
MYKIRFITRREKSTEPLYIETPDGKVFKDKIDALAKEYQETYPDELIDVIWTTNDTMIISEFQWASAGLSHKFADMMSDRLAAEQFDRYIYTVNNKQQLWCEVTDEDGTRTVAKYI